MNCRMTRPLFIGLCLVLKSLCGAQSLNPAQMSQVADSDQPSTFTSFNERIVDYYAAAVKGNIFSSKDGSFELNASVYGLRTIFHPELNVDTLLLANPLQRNVNFGLQLGMGEGAKVDRFGGSVKWAFINRRDRNAHNFGEDLASSFDGLNQALFSADSSYMAYLKTHLGDSSGTFKVFYDQYETSLKNYTASQDPRDLEPVFFRKYGNGIKSRAQKIRAAVDSIAEEIDKRLLATAEISGGYGEGDGGGSYWGLTLESYRGIGRKGEIKGRTGYRISDSASSWSRFRWSLPAEISYTLVLSKTSESTIDLTALAGTEFHGMVGRAVTDGLWVNTYGLGISLPIKKGFSLPLVIKNDSFTAWHGTASVELSLNLRPN
jgi:hypothetical protein